MKSQRMKKESFFRFNVKLSHCLEKKTAESTGAANLLPTRLRVVSSHLVALDTPSHREKRNNPPELAPTGAG